MSAKYREDPDLNVLAYADNEMLKVLANYLLYDKDSKARYSEELSASKTFKQAQEKDDYVSVWKYIATELQHFGGDTLVNTVRGKGVGYKEVLLDVCGKMNVKANESQQTIEIEQALLASIFEKAWEDMTEEERKNFQESVGIDGKLAGPAALAAMIAAINAGGFASYQVALLVANSVARAITGKGLQLAVNAGISKYLAVFAGPVGIAITALMTVPMVTGTAFRVTLPAVVQVAAIRQQLQNKEHF